MPVEAAARKQVKGPKGQIYLFRGFANIFSTEFIVECLDSTAMSFEVR